MKKVREDVQQLCLHFKGYAVMSSEINQLTVTRVYDPLRPMLLLARSITTVVALDTAREKRSW